VNISSGFSNGGTTGPINIISGDASTGIAGNIKMMGGKSSQGQGSSISILSGEGVDGNGGLLNLTTGRVSVCICCWLFVYSFIAALIAPLSSLLYLRFGIQIFDKLLFSSLTHLLTSNTF
jgi:hypothetical protein